MKKRTSWGDDLFVEKPILDLYEPIPAILNQCKEALAIETVPKLTEKFKQIRLLFKKYKFVIHATNKDKGFPQEWNEVFRKESAYRKGELVEIMAFFLADSRNFKLLLSKLPEDVQKIWKIVMEYYFADNELLKHLTGKNWISTKNRYYYSYDATISDELPWFDYTSMEADHYEKKYLFLPLRYRRFLSDSFFLERISKFPDLTALPADEAYHLFNNEVHIFHLLPVIESIYKQDMLTMTKYKIAASSIKKASKILNAREFFPNNEDKTVASLRIYQLLSAYTFFRETSSEFGSATEVIIRKLIKHIMQYPGLLISIALPHVNGMRQTLLSSSNAPGQVRNILQLLKGCSTTEWTDIRKICLQLRSFDLVDQPSILFQSFTLQRAAFSNTKQDKKLIGMSDVYREMGVPFVKGILFMLASLGVVEVAYTNHDPQSPSYFCSLAYFRLTSLGAYALGIDKRYNAPVVEEESRFELSDNNLIIRSISDENPFESLMSDIAISIGSHRFKVDAASFLKNCMTQEDIKSKIAFFKQHVCPSPPQNWEDFFRMILQRCNPLKHVAVNKYSIYQLNVKDKELQRIVSSDPFIRQHTKRAEDYLLLIENAYLNEVVAKLKSFGYLLLCH